MKNIGFIGIGVMGASMVKNLLKAGYDVSIYNRTKSKAQDCIDAGAVWCDTIAECSKNKEAVITIVGFPNDVEEVYFGSNGIIESADKDTYIIDMTTTAPSLAERIFDAAKERGLKALDAPVSGGDKGAKEATEILEKASALFAIAGCMAGLCEAIAYMDEKGLDPDSVFSCISKGAAGSKQIDLYAERMISGDYAPGFYIKHFIKDMKIAKDEYVGELPILNKVLEMHEELAEEGFGELGTQGFIKSYKK